MRTPDLSFVQLEISQIGAVKALGGGLDASGAPTFLSHVQRAVELTFKEKELIVFALLQWIVIVLVYFLWIQFLGWIPASVWEDSAKLNDVSLNLAFFAWSFLCVGLAAFPIALLTGCMGAVHFLRETGHRSTIASAFGLVAARLWPLWIFHWMDGWITVERLLARLPKKGERLLSLRKAAEELLYYAWKFGTVGFFPALLSGKSLLDAGRDAVRLVKERPLEVVRLRAGYSFFCWILGIATYVAVAAWYVLDRPRFEAPHGVHHFYVLMGLPLVIAVGIVQLILRPVFILGACQLYSEMLRASQEPVLWPQPPGRAAGAIAAFAVLALLIAVVFIFREDLGLMRILRAE